MVKEVQMPPFPCRTRRGSIQDNCLFQSLLNLNAAIYSPRVEILAVHRIPSIKAYSVLVQRRCHAPETVPF